MVKILQFWREGGKIRMHGRNGQIYKMVDITNEPRARIIPKDMFLQHSYNIDKNVFMVRNSLMMKMAQTKGESDIEALYFRHLKKDVIIVSKKAYIFWNGKSVEPEKFSFLYTQEQIDQKLKEVETK